MRSVKITSDNKDHRRCCVPCALSTVLNKPYNEVNAWLKYRGYRRGDNNGTYTHRINMNEIGLSRIILPKAEMTVNQFINSLTDNTREATYLVKVSGHCLAVKRGIAYDTIVSEKRRIQEVYSKIQEEIPSDWSIAQKVELNEQVKKQNAIKVKEVFKKKKAYSKKLKKQFKEKKKDPNFKLELLLKRQKQWGTKLKRAQTSLKKINSAIKRSLLLNKHKSK